MMQPDNQKHQAHNAVADVDPAASSEPSGISFSHRLRATPWYECWCGRWLGRAEADLRVKESGLPKELCVLVREVLMRVSLRRSERLDVADELLRHFEDGLSGGRTAVELVKSFGDVRAVSKLINRAKRRNRSVMWQMWVRSLQGVGALLCLTLVSYFGAVFYYFSGEIVVSHDFVADVTAVARAVPADERAWPVYRAALMGIQPDLEIHEGNFPGAYPGDPLWETTAAAIAKHPAAMEELRRATKMAGLGYVVSRHPHAEDQSLWEMGYHFSGSGMHYLTDSIYGIPARHLSALRIASRLLVADIYIAADADDADRVFQDGEALLSMIRHYRESTTWSSDLLSTGFTVTTGRAIGDVIATKPDLLSKDQIEQLAHRLSVAGTAGQGGTLRIRVEPQMNALRDVIQRCYTDDGDGDGHLGVAGIRNLMSTGIFAGNGGNGTGGFLRAPWIAATAVKRSVIEDWLREFTDAYNAQLSKPMWEWSKDIDVNTVFAIHEHEMKWSNRYSLLNYFWSTRSGVIESGEIGTMRRDAVLTAMALELFRRDHTGEYPAELELLVPKYLPKVPRDRFNGKPMGYRFSDGKPLLYSVSIDQRDDGGEGLNPRNSYPGLGRTWIPPSMIVEEDDRLYAPNWLGERVEIPRGDWILWRAGMTEAEIHPREW